jgi:esterase/lipase
MSKIFLLPGLGADCRLYQRIDLTGHDVECADWIEPDKNDTLASYAQKMVNHYHIEGNSIVIGTSLGGMVAVEIAKIVHPEKVILISCPKTVNEMPAFLKVFRVVPVYKFIPAKSFSSLGFLIRLVFGQMAQNGIWLFKDMLRKSSPTFSRWAMAAALHWDNMTIPTNLYHITGDKDLVFPSKNIKNAEIIKGGEHTMVFEKADEVNKYLNWILAA